jgi:hypothetical protein
MKVIPENYILYLYLRFYLEGCYEFFFLIVMVNNPVNFEKRETNSTSHLKPLNNVKKTAQIHFHSKQTYTIPKMNDSISIDSIIAEPVNAGS